MSGFRLRLEDFRLELELAKVFGRNGGILGHLMTEQRDHGRTKEAGRLMLKIFGHLMTEIEDTRPNKMYKFKNQEAMAGPIVVPPLPTDVNEPSTTRLKLELVKYTRARSSARVRHEPRFQAQARAREIDKTSAVCGPHLQTSAAEEVDQMSAVCNKKTGLELPCKIGGGRLVGSREQWKPAVGGTNRKLPIGKTGTCVWREEVEGKTRKY
ncbi:hypothetical protein LXL04_020020 [Taraxacum kok-saghyz]